MSHRQLRIHEYPRAIVNRPFFPDNCGLVDDSADPDIVAVPTVNDSPFEIYRQISRARARFGWRPLVYAHYGEIHVPIEPNRRNADYVFSFEPSGGNNCQHERYHTLEHLVAYLAERRTLAAGSAWAAPKTRFCNFVYSNDHIGSTEVRERFAQKLMKLGQVDCPGLVFNNMPRLTREVGGNAGTLAKLGFLKSYRFTIAFENESADYYATEKILHPLLVGSIPIYWGCPQIAEYYNPDCFINCHDYPSFDDVIDRIMEVEADADLQEAYRRAPILLDDSRIHRLHEGLYARHRTLVDEAFERRKRGGETPIRKWARCGAMVARNLALEVDLLDRYGGGPWRRIVNLAYRTVARSRHSRRLRERFPAVWRLLARLRRRVRALEPRSRLGYKGGLPRSDRPTDR